MTHTIDLTGSDVVISGGSGALGRAIIQRLTDAGAIVVNLDRLPPQAPAANEHHVETELTDEASIERSYRQAVEILGHEPATVFVHAGIIHDRPLLDYTADEFSEVYRVNVVAAYLLGRTAARSWQAADSTGHLVFTSSWVSRVPWPGIAAYSSSKAAVSHLARSFAEELAPSIRANILTPGIVDAGMAQIQYREDPSYRARTDQAIALERLQPVESVADTALYLASPLAGYATGSDFTVDGGCSLYPLR